MCVVGGQVCYLDEVRNGSAPIYELEFAPEQWSEEYCFQYLQETFCAGSDTCASSSAPRSRDRYGTS